MRRSWLGLALLSASWLLGLGYYHQPNWIAYAVVVAAGTALLWRPWRSGPSRLVAAAAAILLAPAALLAPWPYRTAFLLLAAGSAAMAIPSPGAVLRRLGEPLAAAGAVLAVQALALLAYASCVARQHDAGDLAAWCAAGLLRLVGIDAAAGTHIAMFSMRQAHRMPVTWPLLADPVTLCFLVGGGVLILLRVLDRPAGQGRVGPAAAWSGLLALLVAAWLPVRMVLLLAIYMHRALRTGYDDPLDLMGPFWSAWMHLAMLGGPVLLAWAFLRPAAPRPEAPGRRALPFAWQPAAAALVSAAAAAAILAAVAWDPVGQRKAGRVLVDDYHSLAPWPNKAFDTTRTDRPFDTTWYGEGSAYNYACIYDYLSRFYTMSRQMQPLSREALAGCDVLVLKVPSLAYTSTEIDAIREFVQAGGGLMLLGEHTAVFGSGANLNEIARKFGFRFRYDCAFGIDSVFEQHYRPPVVPHPIIQHMGELEFATSCTIDPAGPGRAVIQDAGLKSLHADYHVPNFYPPAENRPEMRYGPFVQLWATRHGAGRVVAFTDSTIFASMSVFEPGKSELMLGMLEWLNHSNRMFDPRLSLALLGVLLAGAAAALARPAERYWPILAAGAACGWAVASLGLAALQRSAMPLPVARRSMVRVAFDRTVSDVELPRNGFIAGKETGFGIFERSILRLGYFTCRAAAGEVPDCDAVVVIQPNRLAPREYRDRLAQYVASGGKLVILDSPRQGQDASLADSLLHPYNLRMKRPYMTSLEGRLDVPAGWPAPVVDSAFEVEGGTPLALLNGRPVAAVVKHGKGSVWVLGFGSRFCDYSMGVVGDVVPQGELLRVYEFQYALFRSVVAGAPPSSLPATTRPLALQIRNPQSAIRDLP